MRYRLQLPCVAVLLPLLLSCGRTVPIDSGDVFPHRVDGGDPIVSVDPVAVITPSTVTADRGELVVLNGTASYDPKGEDLSFKWRLLSAVPTSSARLSSNQLPTTSILVDQFGGYEVELVVSAGGRKSAPAVAVVIVSPPVQNPLADAGADRAAIVGDIVRLNGSNSRDPTGARLTFNWSFSTRPPLSHAPLSDSTSATPWFVPDQPGTYELNLVVTTEANRSDSDSVRVIVTQRNRAPVAEAGDPISATKLSPVQLDGSRSSDPDGDPLSYSWRVVSSPTGAPVALKNSGSARPGFTPESVGVYSFELEVSDGRGSSDTDVTTVSVADDSSPGTGEIFDPGEIYIAGTLSQGACYRDAIAHLSTPNTASVGFDCYFDEDGAMIRPTDGRLLYTNTFEDVVREYHCDACTYSGTYPGNVLANDTILKSPCTSLSDEVSSFRVSPDGVVLQTCWSSPRLWRDTTGSVVYDESAGGLVALGSGGWILTRTSVVNATTSSRNPISGLPARNWLATRWNPPDGFYVALAGPAGDSVPELWRVSTSGAAVINGAYGPLPVNTRSAGQARLDKAGRLFSQARDTTQSFVDVIIRQEVGAASAVVYTEASNPLVKLHISSLVTGP